MWAIITFPSEIGLFHEELNLFCFSTEHHWSAGGLSFNIQAFQYKTRLSNDESRKEKRREQTSITFELVQENSLWKRISQKNELHLNHFISLHRPDPSSVLKSTCRDSSWTAERRSSVTHVHQTLLYRQNPADHLLLASEQKQKTGALGQKKAESRFNC